MGLIRTSAKARSGPEERAPTFSASCSKRESEQSGDQRSRRGDGSTRRREIEAAIVADALKRARGARTGPSPIGLRDELAALGVAIKDNKDGTTTWEPKR